MTIFCVNQTKKKKNQKQNWNYYEVSIEVLKHNDVIFTAKFKSNPVSASRSTFDDTFTSLLLMHFRIFNMHKESYVVYNYTYIYMFTLRKCTCWSIKILDSKLSKHISLTKKVFAKIFCKQNCNNGKAIINWETKNANYKDNI